MVRILFRSAGNLGFQTRGTVALVLSAVVFCWASPTQACWVQGPILPGGAIHYYEVVAFATPIDWSTAQSNAVAAGGYLATITSAGENAFVYNLAFADSSAWGSVALLEYGPWLGGFQLAGSSEPAGGWQWIPADPFVYTSWNTSIPEPNDFGGVEDKLHYHARWAPAGTWNDLQPSGEGRIFGYVIERDTTPDVVCPTVSTWGVVVMTLLTLTAGTVVLRGKRARVAG